MKKEEYKMALRLMMSNFHLGGSRRMASKYPDIIQIAGQTDWDFYCSDTKGNRDYLISLGFELVQCDQRNYWDNLLLDIYKHPILNIEVLIRSDVELYSMAFESISGEVFYNKLWKSSPVNNRDKAAFRQEVCCYFNELFRNVRTKKETQPND